MQRSQQVQHTCRRKKSRPIVTFGVRDIRTLCFKRSRREIKRSCPEIGDVAEHSKRVAAFRTEKVSTHPNAKKNQRSHCQEAAECAPPHFLQRVAQPWDKPTGNADGECHSFIPLVMRRGNSGLCRGRRCVCRRVFGHFSSYDLVY